MVQITPMPSPKPQRGARKSIAGRPGDSMSLRVQARDTKGNIFVWATAPDEDIALDLACSWIEQLPGLTVEVVGVHD
jgi:hypothetical protein